MVKVINIVPVKHQHASHCTHVSILVFTFSAKCSFTLQHGFKMSRLFSCTTVNIQIMTDITARLCKCFHTS